MASNHGKFYFQIVITNERAVEKLVQTAEEMRESVGEYPWLSEMAGWAEDLEYVVEHLGMSTDADPIMFDEDEDENGGAGEGGDMELSPEDVAAIENGDYGYGDCVDYTEELEVELLPEDEGWGDDDEGEE